MSITTEFANGIARIEINRPQKRNMLTSQMCEDMVQALISADLDPEIRAILIHGQSNIFCAGFDLEELLQKGSNTQVSASQQLINQIDRTKKTIIAAVTGPAVAMGTAILYHCDLVYCGEHSLFSLPNIALGLTPQFGVSFLAVRSGGYRKAAQKILLSEPISPIEAISMGLVNEIFDDEQVLAQATARAQRLASLPPLALESTKQLLKAAGLSGLDDFVEQEQRVFSQHCGSDENKEAFSAFMEKRMPNFSKKQS